MSLSDIVGGDQLARPASGRSTSADGVSLSEYAYTHLLEMILTGKLQPGEFLQERRLAEMLSISRTPVRDALGRLEAESLVTRAHGRGPVVADVSIESYVMLLDMRRILEVEAAGRATGRLPQATGQAVINAINTLVDLKDPTPADHWAVDDLLHGTIAEAAGNPLIASTIRDLRRRTHLFNTNRIPNRLVAGAGEHLSLIQSILGEDADRSRKLMGQHLDNVRDAIIEFLLGAKRLR